MHVFNIHTFLVSLDDIRAVGTSMKTFYTIIYAYEFVSSFHPFVLKFKIAFGKYKEATLGFSDG